MGRKRTTGLFALALILGPAAVSAAEAEETILIGFGGGLSGPAAFRDGLVRNGTEMAVNDINAGGGVAGKYRIDFQVKDVAADPAAAATAGKEFVAGGARIMIAPCDFDAALAFARTGQQAGIPVIAPCVSTPTLAATVGDLTFQLYPSANLQAAVLAKFAWEQGYGTAYTLASARHTEKLPFYFAEAFEKLGGNVVGTDAYAAGQSDFSDEVAKIKGMRAPPDVIMIAAAEPDFPILLQQLRDAGVTTAVLGSDVIDSPLTPALGDIAEGVAYTAAGFPKPGGSLVAFYRDYVARYGGDADTDISPHAAIGYEAIQLAAEAIARAGTTDGRAVGRVLDAIADFPGISGSRITLAGANRVALREVALIRIERGAKTLVRTVRPDTAEVPAPQ